MKRLVPICIVLIGALLLMAAHTESVAAPKVYLKVVGKSMNQLRGVTTAWQYNSGLTVTGKGTRVFLYADTTGSNDTTVTSWAWNLTAKPAGSTAAFDSGASHVMDNSFLADSTGTYTVEIVANATGSSKSSTVTVIVSTYLGNTKNPADGCFCHAGVKTEFFNKWAKTPHATILERGMKGQLEVIGEVNAGLYKQSCTQCHGVAPDPKVDNGNYAFLANNTPAKGSNSWDSTWYKGLPLASDGSGDVLITTGVDTIWNKMPANVKLRATIGCENCHGPADKHKTTGAKTDLAIERASDPCLVCHDGSGRHGLGTWWRKSLHNTGHTIYGEGSNSSCAKCHSGAGFIDWVKGGKASNPTVQPGYEYTSIGCPTCHDPHDTTNLDLGQVRTADVKLTNNFVPPGRKAGFLCMNCHQQRSAGSTYVKPNEAAAPDGKKYYGFKSRFYPHHSNQGDMLYGQNSYEYGDARLSGLNTHANLEGACVTCHMAMRPTSASSGLPNHQFSMDTASYSNPGFHPKYNPGKACESCHGVEEPEMIQAAWDYDGDQTVESAMGEVEGLVAKLEAQLPKRDGAVIGGGTVTAADSAAVANRLDLVAGIWTYWFVEEDRSKGMHNAKYTVQLLGKALNEKWANIEIERDDLTTPDSYLLSQNYPNPFNPSTTIHFAIPKTSEVRVDIYDMTGRHVTTLLNTAMSAGNYRVTWNGDDRDGAKVASGMYLYRLNAGSFAMTKKMLLVK